MKNFILIAAIALLAVSAKAQNVVPYAGALTSVIGLPIDTITNTATAKLTSARVAGPAQTVTVGTSTVNISGTQAGVSRLYGSLDNVHFTRIRTGMLYGTQVDSLKIDVNTLNYHWIITGNPFNYYQVQTTGIGTVSFNNKAYIVKH